MKTMSAPAGRDRAVSGRTAVPAVAGLLYAAAWAAGLVIGPAAVRVTATDAEVASAYAENPGLAIIQVVLTEGVAAGALAVVVVALGQAARSRRARGLAARAEVAGLAAAGLSLVQCALGLLLAGWAAPDGDSSAAGSLFRLISRIDGAKMLLLAALALSGMALARRAGPWPAWTRWPSLMLAVALTGSGLGYLLLAPPLAALAYLSPPLLLIWVAGAGLWLAKDAGDAADQQPGCHRHPPPRWSARTRRSTDDLAPGRCAAGHAPGRGHPAAAAGRQHPGRDGAARPGVGRAGRGAVRVPASWRQPGAAVPDPR